MNRKDEEKAISIASELYSLRTLVFLETEPQSNKYCQVLLDRESYKKITENMCIKKVDDLDDEHEIFDMRLSEDEYALPDLRDVHYE